MHKDFDGWNEVKKSLQARNMENLYFKEREVRWCSLGVNMGHEEDGKGNWFKRPVLILKKINAQTFLILPLSTKIKSEAPDRVTILCPDNIYRDVLLSHIRLIDSRRLFQKMFILSPSTFSEIKEKIKQSLA